MKALVTIVTFVLFSVTAFGQFMPGGMGGMGGMGRRGMGGQMAPTPSSPRASVPNIAGDIANKETGWLKENLALTKEQGKAVKKLNNEYAEMQQDAIKDIVVANTGADGRPSPETRKQIQEVMLMFNEEKEEKLKPILTPEQWTLYQSKKEQMQKDIGGFRPPAPKGFAKPDSAGSAKQ